MSQDVQAEQFVRRLTECQPALYAFIRSLLPDADVARDVLQETNVLLWRKAAEFVEGTNFNAWAYRTARYMVLSAYRDRQRDRHIFDEELLATLADEAGLQEDDDDQFGRALDECLAKLPATQRQMLAERYAQGGSMAAVARRLGRTARSASVTLCRIRSKLAECVRRGIAEAAG
jgi:RNA polymerase sigma-70 factor (ECF subfamily)